MADASEALWIGRSSVSDHLTESLVEGENVVSADVGVAVSSGVFEGGLLAQIVLIDSDGNVKRLSSDDTWMVSASMPRGGSWRIPAAMGGDDGGVEWLSAAILSSYDDSKWGELWLDEYDEHPRYSEFKGEYEDPKMRHTTSPILRSTKKPAC